MGVCLPQLTQKDRRSLGADRSVAHYNQTIARDLVNTRSEPHSVAKTIRRCVVGTRSLVASFSLYVDSRKRRLLEIVGASDGADESDATTNNPKELFLLALIRTFGESGLVEDVIRSMENVEKLP